MCTGIKLVSKKGNVFFGRTMDLNISMFNENSKYNFPACIIKTPSNFDIKSQNQNWTTKYSTMGVGLKDSSILYDGINEYGLSGDFQVLMECTKEDKDKIISRKQTPILAEESVSYILSQFKSVKEIRDNYKNWALIDQPFMHKGISFNFPIHLMFTDKTGDAVVLEPVKNGSFVLYNLKNVMTNSPEYDWHTTNIRNYINLNNKSNSEKKF